MLSYEFKIWRTTRLKSVEGVHLNNGILCFRLSDDK